VAKRNKSTERLLLDKARAWLGGDENRQHELHASDLLDPRMAYFAKTDPRPLTDRLVTMFMVGKVLHAFVINSLDEEGGPQTLSSDEGSAYSEELGIYYSIDKMLHGRIRELKTSRSYYEPKDVEKDLGTYIEQLLVYMVAKNACDSQLCVLYLNFKDDEGKTAPTFRAYDIVISEADLSAIREYLLATKELLQTALDAKTPELLPLCREFKCGRKNCEWYDKCKPEGRYGVPRWDGKAKQVPRLA
jgi:hypothetical protein